MTTQNAKHTPGPWRVGRNGGCVVSDTPSENAIPGSDAVEYYGGHLIGESITKANAAFIAAAPETAAELERVKAVNKKLVEALEFVVRDINCCGKDVEIYATALAKARAALSRAEKA